MGNALYRDNKVIQELIEESDQFIQSNISILFA